MPQVVYWSAEGHKIAWGDRPRQEGESWKKVVSHTLDLDALEARLARVGEVRRSPQLLNADLGGISLTIFSDGRCVVRGTEDPGRAVALYDRYVGR